MGGVERIKTKPKQLLPISELIGKVGSAGAGLIQSKIDADHALSIEYNPGTLYHDERHIKYDPRRLYGYGYGIDRNYLPGGALYDPIKTSFEDKFMPDFSKKVQELIK